MSIPWALATAFGLACAVLTGCQGTPPFSAQSERARPAPLPAWTKAKGDGGIRNGRQVKFAVKFIEVTRSGAENIPNRPYRKKMNAAELQAFLRSLAQQRGTDIMTAPTITALEGQTGHARVGRQFPYPESAGSTPPLTGEFVGVTHYVRARPARNGGKLKLDVLAQVTEFEGFDGTTPETRRPVFSTRRAESSGELASGETIVIGGVVTGQQQTVEDKIPLLGDIPLVGLAFRSRQISTFRRELIVVVTPTVVE